MHFEDTETTEPEEVTDAAIEQELLELKEKQKALLHQLNIALTEKDAIRKQLNDLRINGNMAVLLQPTHRLTRDNS